jgi:transcriptional regulator with XRE-family HTH domain
MEQFRDVIRAARSEKGWSQAKLAKEVGLWTTAVAKIESGVRAVEVHEALAIAAALGFSIDALADLPTDHRKRLSEIEIRYLSDRIAADRERLRELQANQ